MSSFDTLFDETTPLGQRAVLPRATFDTHIMRGKWGYGRPSAFELKDSVTNPLEVLQSQKDQNSLIFVKAVGMVGTRNWFTVTFVKIIDGKISTGFNAVTYSQKGTKVWPSS